MFKNRRETGGKKMYGKYLGESRRVVGQKNVTI